MVYCSGTYHTLVHECGFAKKLHLEHGNVTLRENDNLLV
jgi:hypothetical protein